MLCKNKILAEKIIFCNMYKEIRAEKIMLVICINKILAEKIIVTTTQWTSYVRASRIFWYLALPKKTFYTFALSPHYNDTCPDITIRIKGFIACPHPPPVHIESETTKFLFVRNLKNVPNSKKRPKIRYFGPIRCQFQQTLYTKRKCASAKCFK